MEYIKSEKSEDCIFCSLPGEGDDTKNYILYRGQSAFIIMNIFPYNSAHLMKFIGLIAVFPVGESGSKTHCASWHLF